ncbi:IS701 family transposase [Micromonospora chersina]|uniref:IS701 family transposase n=1 Tax=Micromonospora chersina TaxID=47854 RepID=UPI00345473EC
MGLVAGRFGRVEPRCTAWDLVLGLLSPVERKNCWWLAEQAGHRGPQAMQRLLRTAVWDADAVRDDVRGFVTSRLGEADGVLIPDETGFLKKGTGSVGVQRQYSGTAGRVENSQVGVFLSYASARGRALIDRRVYLPKSWTDDPDRCADVGVPAEVGFATKPQLALDMIAQAVAAGVPAGWAASDELYGDNAPFRAGVQALGLGYVLAVARNHLVPIDGGKVCVPAEHLADQLPATAWHRISCGTGSKGPRWYDWAWLDASTPGHPGRSLLIRRGSDGTLAFYRCWNPTPTSLADLVRVAGIRWTIEEGFQAGKSQVGLDHYQVRGWTAWHRWITLAMLALAVLMTAAAAAAPPPPADSYHHARHATPIA